MRKGPRPVFVAALLTLLSISVAGCSHLPQPHWPWHKTATPPPQEVHELVITTPEGAERSFPQYWKRNTLVVDLKSGGSSGSIVLKPRPHTVWPVRLAFRVVPGQFAELEVRGNQRVVLPITTAGAQSVDLELDPGVYIMKSPQITVTWGTPSAAAQDQSSGT